MKNDELKQSNRDILDVVKNESWLRGDPYRWAQASLPLAYAVAYVEMVIEESVKARDIYNQLVTAWGKTRHNGNRLLRRVLLTRDS